MPLIKTDGQVREIACDTCSISYRFGQRPPRPFIIENKTGQVTVQCEKCAPPRPKKAKPARAAAGVR